MSTPKCDCDKLNHPDPEDESKIQKNSSSVNGSHIAFRAQVSDTLLFAISTGMGSLQFFLGSQQSYSRSSLTLKDIERAREILKITPLSIFTHSPLIYNLAGSVKMKSLAWQGNESVDKMIMSLVNSLNGELSTLTKIGAIGTVIHPGYSIDGKTADALTAIAQTLNKVIFSGAKVILEICAGEKGRIGVDLKQLNEIRNQVVEEKQKFIGFCVDTAHAFGSGLYNLSKCEEVKKMFEDIDSSAGKVEVIHLNDSCVPFNSKKDRHAILRSGFIWSENDQSLRLLLEMARIRNIPCVLETVISDMNTLFELETNASVRTNASENVNVSENKGECGNECECENEKKM